MKKIRYSKNKSFSATRVSDEIFIVCAVFFFDNIYHVHNCIQYYVVERTGRNCFFLTYSPLSAQFTAIFRNLNLNQERLWFFVWTVNNICR